MESKWNSSELQADSWTNIEMRRNSNRNAWTNCKVHLNCLTALHFIVDAIDRSRIGLFKLASTHQLDSTRLCELASKLALLTLLALVSQLSLQSGSV